MSAQAARIVETGGALQAPRSEKIPGCKRVQPTMTPPFQPNRSAAPPMTAGPRACRAERAGCRRGPTAAASGHGIAGRTSGTGDGRAGLRRSSFFGG